MKYFKPDMEALKLLFYCSTCCCLKSVSFEALIYCTLKWTLIAHHSRREEGYYKGSLLMMSPSPLLLTFLLEKPPFLFPFSTSLLLILPALPTISTLSCLKCEPAHWQSWKKIHIALSHGQDSLISKAHYTENWCSNIISGWKFYHLPFYHFITTCKDIFKT